MANNTVFISYSREDTNFMRQLKARLEQQGITVWVDENIKGGSTWDNIIEEALSTSDSIIVVLSKASVSSRMVMNEVSYGIEEDKGVIPVMVEECKVPFRLRRIQFIDFIEDFDKGVVGVLDALDRNGPATAPKADPIIAPTQPGGPEVVKERLAPTPPPEKPLETPTDTTSTTAPTKKKSTNLALIIGAALVVIILAVSLIVVFGEEEEDPSDDVIAPSVEEVAWQKAKNGNTVEGFVSYANLFPIEASKKEQDIKTAISAKFPKTGYLQYSESNGTKLFTRVYPMSQLSGPPEIGDVLSSIHARRIRGNAYGEPGYATVYRLIKVGERVVVRKVIPSGSAYWIEIGYRD